MISDNIYSLLGTLINKSATIEISDRIKKLNIICDYDSYLFPVIYADIYLTVEEYNYIQKDDDTKLRLSCKKYKLNNNGQALTNYEEIFKNIEFVILNKDDFYIQDNNTNSNTQSENLINCRLVLMNKEDLEGNKNSFLGSFLSCDIQKVLYYIVTKLNQNKKTIIEQPDNIKIYDQILLPYNTPYRQLAYLDNVYGIYKDGMKVFFDLNQNYILNKYENKNVKNKVIIEVKDTTELLLDFLDLDDNRLVIQSNALSYVNAKNSRNEYIGNNNAFVLNDTNNSILKQNTGGNKTNVYYQKYSNPFIKNVVTSNINSLIQIYIENANYNIFNFLTEFTIKESKNLFKNEKFNLAKYMHTFTLNQSNYFTLSTIMNLKKI